MCSGDFLRLGPIQGTLPVAKLPFHDFFQLPILTPHIPWDQLGGFFLPQAAFQMHIVFDLIPFHKESGAVGAEYAVRGVFRVRLRVIAQLGHHFLRVVAGKIPVEGQLQPPPALGIGCQSFGVVPNLGGRHLPL